jgi:hypothetical protein
LLNLLCESKTSKASSRADKVIGQIKIMITFVQILSSMKTTYNGIPWPLEFLSFVVPLGVINLDVIGLFGTTVCSMAVPFSSKFLVHVSMPPMLSFGIVMANLISKLIRPPQTTESRNHRWAATSKQFIGMLLFMYPGLATRCFQMFKCSKFDGINYSVLEADPSMICYQEKHSMYMILSFIFICLYVIGVPLTMFILLFRNKHHLYVKEGEIISERQKEVDFQLGGLYTQCKWK